MDENELGFDERRFLELYRRFYGDRYPAVKDGNQNAHVKGQKVVYLLMLKQMYVGDYGFVWQRYGPCSDALQKLMRRLDRNPKPVKAFYERFPDNVALNPALYSDDPNAKRLFSRGDAAKIDALRAELNLPKEDERREDGDTPVRRWMELLGSLAYISNTRLPCANEERIWQELESAKSKAKYKNAPERENALQTLRSAALLSCVGA